jgi:hypothetical protein
MDTSSTQQGSTEQANWQPPFHADPERLIDLYKYYEGVGATARGQMVTSANWFLTLAIALLVFVSQSGFRATTWTDVCREPTPLALLAGLVVCGVAYVVVGEFYDHVNRNWMRATRCKYLVPDLHVLVSDGQADKVELKEMTEGSLPEVTTVDSFRDHGDEAPGPRERVRGLFRLYRRGTLVLGLVFLVMAYLAITENTCEESGTAAAATAAAENGS